MLYFLSPSLLVPHLVFPCFRHPERLVSFLTLNLYCIYVLFSAIPLHYGLFRTVSFCFNANHSRFLSARQSTSLLINRIHVLEMLDVQLMLGRMMIGQYTSRISIQNIKTPSASTVVMFIHIEPRSTRWLPNSKLDCFKYITIQRQ